MSEAELTLDLNQTPYSINTRPDLLNTSEAGQRNEGIMKSSSNDLYYANNSVLHRTALVFYLHPAPVTWHSWNQNKCPLTCRQTLSSEATTKVIPQSDDFLERMKRISNRINPSIINALCPAHRFYTVTCEAFISELK